MLREKATAREDLPHKFQLALDQRCAICTKDALDLRHLAWEKAAAHEATTFTLPRERGV